MIRKTLSVSAFAMLFGISTLSYASTTPVISGDMKVQSITSLTDQESHVVSMAAAAFLKHVEKAKLALQKNDRKTGRENIHQALKLIAIIQNALPTYKVTTHIRSKQTKYSESEVVKQRNVEVLDDSSMLDLITPMTRAKKVEPNADSDVSVYERTTVTLDSASAGQLIKQANKAEKANDTKAAIRDLATLETDAVSLVSDEVPLPLISAIENLQLAQGEMTNKDYKDALQTLKVASIDLKSYEKLTGDKYGKDVRKTTEKIDNLVSKADTDKDIRSMDRLMENAHNDIATWMSKANGWLHHLN